MHLLALTLLTMTPAQLTALREHRDAEEKKADLLAREGLYAEAVQVTETLLAELKTKLKDVPVKEQEGAYLATSASVLQRELDELVPMAAWAAASGTDAKAATRLLLAVLHPKRTAFDGFVPKMGDPQVQRLLASLRKLDPKAAKLLGPRKVKVVTTGKLDAPSRAHYAAALVTALKALGLDASATAGTEPFEVELNLKGPESAHLIGDDVDECALIAVAKWPAAGLKRLDLTAHGTGDETTDGDCFKSRVTESVALAAEQVFRTAVQLPLAENLNKADGPNGIFK